jgi:hypothetical protein
MTAPLFHFSRDATRRILEPDIDFARVPDVQLIGQGQDEREDCNPGRVEQTFDGTQRMCRHAPFSHLRGENPVIVR